MLSKGNYSITLYAGTGSRSISGTTSSITGKNINISVSANSFQTREYSTSSDVLLKINIGKKGYTDNSLGIFEYDRYSYNVPENCEEPINPDMHEEKWQYECFEWGIDGKISIVSK